MKSIQSRTSLKRVIATGIKDYLPWHLKLGYTLLKEGKEGERIKLGDGDYRFARLLRRFRGASLAEGDVRADSPAVILMSGGTTGTPKGVVGTHRGMVTAGIQLQAWLRPAMNPWTDTIMMPLPLFHTYGNDIGLFALLLFLNVFALTFAVLRRFFLKNTGQKLVHLDKQVKTGHSILSQEIANRYEE